MLPKALFPKPKSRKHLSQKKIKKPSKRQKRLPRKAEIDAMLIGLDEMHSYAMGRA